MEFVTLEPHVEIAVGVINSWCSYLNHMEKFRAVSSPSRLFLTTYACSYTIVTRPSTWDDKRAAKEFSDRLNLECSRINGFKWSDCDMVFFPICANDHYYAMCFGLRSGDVEILDNSNAGGERRFKDVYGDIPTKLFKLFCSYVAENCSSTVTATLRKSKVTVVDMPWRNDSNKKDCGVYLMRHMETYMGQAIKDWPCGLTKKSGRALQVLRAKYCKAMLDADENIHAYANNMSSERHMVEAKKEGKIDVDKILNAYIKRESV